MRTVLFTSINSCRTQPGSLRQAINNTSNTARRCRNCLRSIVVIISTTGRLFLVLLCYTRDSSIYRCTDQGVRNPSALSINIQNSVFPYITLSTLQSALLVAPQYAQFPLANRLFCNPTIRSMPSHRLFCDPTCPEAKLDGYGAGSSRTECCRQLYTLGQKYGGDYPFR